MAKKKSSVNIQFSFESSFSVKVADDCLASYTKDLNRNELHLGIEVMYGRFINSYSIYADHITGGSLIFSKVKDGDSSVKITGKSVKEIDINSEKDFIDEIKSKQKLEVYLNSVSDQVPNSYYVDGDDSKQIVIGYCELIG
jgi:hypothetical protein